MIPWFKWLFAKVTRDLNPTGERDVVDVYERLSTWDRVVLTMHAWNGLDKKSKVEILNASESGLLESKKCG